MTLWNQLAALFLPTRRLHGDAGGRLQRGGVFGGQQWVATRGQCQYRREDLQALPPRRRAQAGKLVAARHRPSPATLAHVAWTGGIAHLWFWTPADALPADARWLPETLLLPAPAADGLRLLQLEQGFEAQHWQRGALAASQWWPALPDTEAWARFVRAAGQDPAQQGLPQPQQLPWSARPWGELGLAQRLATVFGEKSAWLLLVAVLAAGLGWQAASLLRWQAAGAQLAAQVERVRAEVNPLLDAREHAEQAQAELARLQALRPAGSDYALMATIIARLPPPATLLSWRREGGKLEVLVRSEDTDPREYVAAFEDDKLLSEVMVIPKITGVMQLAFELPVAEARKGAAVEKADE